MPNCLAASAWPALTTLSRASTLSSGDTTTLPDTLASAAEHPAAVEAAPTPTDPAELVADKGYHSRAGLKELEDGPWKSRIAEPRRDGFLRWRGDNAARRAVYNNRDQSSSQPVLSQMG